MKRGKFGLPVNRKAVSMVLLICLIITLSACGNDAGGSAQTTDHSSSQKPLQSENVTVDEQAQTTAPEDTSSKNVLVAYFAFSENIGDTSALGVDAITSASLNRRTDNTEGNLQVMAQAAAEATGGDLFSITVTEPYNPEYNSMAGAAQADQRNGKEFAFVNEIENLEQYDTVYIGIPVWWGKLPQPMVSFFECYDFSGKTIIPFGIHLGSRFGSMITEIRELEPQADVKDGFTISADTDNEKVRNEFKEYLATVN